MQFLFETTYSFNSVLFFCVQFTVLAQEHLVVFVVVVFFFFEEIDISCLQNKEVYKNRSRFYLMK